MFGHNHTQLIGLKQELNFKETRNPTAKESFS